MAQETDVQLKAEAAIIKNETVLGANTANRVGTHLENVVDSKANKTEIPGSTDEVTEGATNLYFTNNRVWNLVLTGLSLVTNSAITAADSILVAFGKLQAQITSLGSTKADKSLIAQTFLGEFNLSTGGEVSYKIYSSNTALTPTVAANPVEESYARVVIDAGASATLDATNMGTPRPGNDTFTVSKKNEIMMACLPDGTDGALVNYYTIKVLN